jgi:hypothetical protein
MDKQHKTITGEVIRLLQGGSAHGDFKKAVNGLPAQLRGVKTHGLPYSIWQLVEHIRIAQWDMLEFSKDGNHQSPNWPDDYWPKQAEPANDEAWKDSIKQIENNLEEFIQLIQSEDLYERIPHGSGQTLLREALQIADHTAYHTAEIIIIRRLLGAWHS